MSNLVLPHEVLVPALPSSVIEPLWEQFAALLPEREVAHPLGCHRPRIPDRVVFDKLVQSLVYGAAYERVADARALPPKLGHGFDYAAGCSVAV